ncbi:MAG: phosphoribosylglycinamide formyltransferase [Phycisphaeraceae bacterium]
MTSEMPKVRHDPIRLAVLLSGGGTTMQNLADEIAAGRLRAKISVVIASNDQAYGLKRAEKLKVPSFVVPRTEYDTAEDFSDHLFDLVRDAGADLVCLAGFLSLLAIPDDFVNRVINIHPSLLPAFGGKGMYGRRVHEAVIETGCKVSGCTVHFANQEYDRGPILIQRTCPVEEDDTPDTLAARVGEQEHIAYPEAIRLIAQRRVEIAEGRTRIKP